MLKLWNVCKYGDVKIVEKLVVKKVGVNVKVYGMVFIYIVVWYGNLDIVRYFFFLGVNVYFVDEEGWIVFYWVSVGGYVIVM